MFLWKIRKHSFFSLEYLLLLQCIKYYIADLLNYLKYFEFFLALFTPIPPIHGKYIILYLMAASR